METKLTYNCHAAAPHQIDFERLQNIPGQLFNADVNVSERQMMLDNIRNPSCGQNCWQAEDRGAISPRILQKGVDKTHFDIRPMPEHIDLTINSNCNLTCSYCCKEYSSSWRNDIAKNGPYKITDEINYSLGDKEKMLMKIGQQELKQSLHYKQLLEEIKVISSSLKRLDITGGEPLLDNQLVDILVSLNLSPDTTKIIYTGLGVDLARLQKLCVKLSKIPNLKLKISAENIGKNLEFNRYGVKWEKFKQAIKIIQDHGINYRFNCTISNLSIFGFADFYNYFSTNSLALGIVYTPRMMAPYVLDIESKQMLTEQFQQLPDEYKLPLIKSMQSLPTATEYQDLRIFLKEFVARRPDLDLKIFPSSFLTWLESNVV